LLFFQPSRYAVWLQIRAGIHASGGVAFLTTAVAILATTISLASIDSYEELSQYYAYFSIAIGLILGGFYLFGKIKYLEKDLDHLTLHGTLDDSKPAPVEKEPTKKTSKLRWLRWFWALWKCKGNYPEAQIVMLTETAWKKS
jgi:hypothetical protein